MASLLAVVPCRLSVPDVSGILTFCYSLLLFSVPDVSGILAFSYSLLLLTVPDVSGIPSCCCSLLLLAVPDVSGILLAVVPCYCFLSLLAC
jgi:hypothetical protein